MDGWSHNQVKLWLEHLRFKDEIIDVFLEYEVTGADLVLLSESELEAMGVTNKLARLRICVKREEHKQLYALLENFPGYQLPKPPPRSTIQTSLDGFDPDYERPLMDYDNNEDFSILRRAVSIENNDSSANEDDNDFDAYEKIPAKQ
eukprot:gene11056-3125_t